MNPFLSAARSCFIALSAMVVLVASAQWLPVPESTSDVQRLRRHFRDVDAELTSRDVSHLSPQQQAARRRNVEVLREYARTGVFPHNHDFAEHAVPYFRDEHGTLCAMAYLIAASGEAELVERIAATNNNAYIPELSRDPELVAWLERNGMTAEEAARVQPQYGWVEGERTDRGYERATVATSVVSGGMIAWTVAANPRRAGILPGVAAIGTGAFGVVLGLAGGMSDGTGGLPVLNAAVGGATTFAGLIYSVRVLNARSGAGQKAAPRSSESRSWQPILDPALDGGTRMGVRLKL